MVSKEFFINKIKVGVDVSCLASPITGIGRYTYEILSRLITIKSIDWILYTNSNSELIDSLTFSNNVRLRVFDVVKLPRLIWSQTILPILIAVDSPHLFWCPTHRVPVLLTDAIPTVVTIHDLTWKFAPKSMKFFSKIIDSFLMPIAVSRANRIIAVSLSTSEDISEEYPNSSKKTTVIHLGATDLSKTVNLNADCVDKLKGKKYILFVGTIEPRKNLKRLLQAFSLLVSSKGGDIYLAIAGGKGWQIESLESICDQLNIFNNVIILNYVTDYELDWLYKNSLFLVFPSLYEGFGLPIVEAMKHGTPSLVSNVYSMPEIAGDAGFVVDPMNVNSILDGMITLLDNPCLLIDLRQNALSRRYIFNWDVSAKLTLDVFCNLVR